MKCQKTNAKYRKKERGIMKLTFVHDGPLFYDKDGNYYEFAYHELLERYSYLADDISFMMRTKPISGVESLLPFPKL